MADEAAPSRHICHCGKSFIRKEHLRRHQAAHTGRAFCCKVCGRAFTRSDLLRRHATLHDSAATSHEPRRERACDACHTNKTKCSGGPQCSLCVKRGIPCAYTRGSAEQSGKQGNDRAVGPPLPPSDDISNASPPNSDSANLLATESAVLLQANESDGHEGQRFDGTSALHILFRALTNEAGSPADFRVILESWLTARIESYLASFHTRWPVLHAPVLNETTDSVQVISTIVMIDLWLYGEANLKNEILCIHDCLVRQLYNELNESNFDPACPWPAELYQLSLLNVIFAFETGRDLVIRQSRMLFSLLVTALRMHGCFQADAIESQRLIHHPGEFKPFIYGTNERWKRIATCTLKIDSYLSLLYYQPPLLRLDELDLGLTSTHALWNSYGIMVFFDRSRSEPWSRNTYRMSQLDVRKSGQVPFGILPEDIHLCLLGMWNEIRSLKKETALSQDIDRLKKADLSQQLSLALEQLETIVAESRKPLVVGGYTTTILKSYLGSESSRSPNWRHDVTNRLDSYISNIKPLLLLLTLHLHADIHTLRHMYLSPAPLKMEPTASWRRSMVKVQEWASSAGGRAAVVASLQTWFAYESLLLINPTQSAHAFDPIVYLALSAGATVLWAWTMNDLSVCVCHPSTPKAEVTGNSMNLQPDVQTWIRGGAGGLSFLGQPVCKCTVPQRMADWTEALATAGRTWEMAGTDANLLRCSWMGT